MAHYQTTTEKFTCEKCGAVEYDIVPCHTCPIETCEECGEEFDTRDKQEHRCETDEEEQ
jgi:hypothetical protein